MSDLHRVLSNLARATLESVVQERWVRLWTLSAPLEAHVHPNRVLVTPFWQVWIPIGAHLPPLAEEETSGAEAGGGFCHDSRQGGQRHALHASLTEPGPAAGRPLIQRTRLVFLFPVVVFCSSFCFKSSCSRQEIPKTPDFAPSRTFYLYTVNQLSTARMLLQNCYKVKLAVPWLMYSSGIHFLPIIAVNH